MFLRIVLGSLGRRGRRKIAALLSITLATGAATGLFAVFLGVGDGVRAEFRANRHNILVEPAVEGGTLRESDLDVIRRELFWRNNIVGFAPLLPVEVFVEGRGPVTVVGTRWQEGLSEVAASWRIEGAWDEAGAFVGERLARRWNLRVGETLAIAGRTIPVRGVVATGEEWDDQVIVPLRVAQEIAGLPGKVKRVLVNAVTTPDSVLVEKFRKDPKSLSPQDSEKMLCTPFATTIALELRERIPNSEARPIRRVTETEGRLLSKVDAVFWMLGIAVLAAGGLGVWSAMTATIVDRRKEIGLLKALGATSLAVAGVFAAEAILLALAGSALGTLLGWGVAEVLSRELLNRSTALPPAAGLAALAGALVVTLGGMLVPLRLALRVDPTRVLHES